MRTIAFAVMQAALRTSPLCSAALAGSCWERCERGHGLLPEPLGATAVRVQGHTQLRCGWCVLRRVQGSSPSFCPMGSSRSAQGAGSVLGEQGRRCLFCFQLLYGTKVRLLGGASCARVLI